ncbi:MAG: hypothetical protein KAR15_10330, partial [Desulfobacterales bacterium]|nr:hypothetical protein [Desulfobacterales bacterium]
KTPICVVLPIMTQPQSGWLEFSAIGRKGKSTSVLYTVAVGTGCFAPGLKTTHNTLRSLTYCKRRLLSMVFYHGDPLAVKVKNERT